MTVPANIVVPTINFVVNMFDTSGFCHEPQAVTVLVAVARRRWRYLYY